MGFIKAFGRRFRRKPGRSMERFLHGAGRPPCHGSDFCSQAQGNQQRSVKIPKQRQHYYFGQQDHRTRSGRLPHYHGRRRHYRHCGRARRIHLSNRRRQRPKHFHHGRSRGQLDSVDLGEDPIRRLPAPNNWPSTSI